MILELQNITGGYTLGHNILHGVDLSIAKGEAVSIIGLNGSGKSTLGKAILNMLPYRGGSFRFNGQDITTCKTSELVNKGISIVHQGAPVFDHLSVWENLLLASDNGRLNINEIQNYFVFLQAEKQKLMSMKADRLSGGQRHQLALAMAILKKPRLMVLDEPSAGLSPTAAKSLYEVLGNIRSTQGISMLIIEQNIALANDFCKITHLLSQGKISHQFENQSLQEIENIMFNNQK